MDRPRISSRLFRVAAILSLAAGVAASVAAPAQATFPGTPGPIAFSKATSSELGSTGGLFAHGPRHAQSSRQLTDDPSDYAPAYSANGRMIAFAGDRDALPTTGSHIYVMKADGSDAPVALTSGSDYDSDPAFSPNGREVVFDRTGGSGGGSHIFVVGVDGNGLRQLTEGAGSDSEPVFTPNGRRIVYTSNRDHDVRTDRSDIFAMAADGDDQRVLIDGPRNESEPDVSPDGRRIVFSSNRHKGPNLFVASANGRHVRALTHSKGDCFRGTCFLSPAFSPDGRHVAALGVGRYKSVLEVMRADGSQMREFASGGTEEEGFGSHVGPPAWGIVPR